MVTRTLATTAEELLHLPDDGMRCELVAGELRVMAPSGAEHGRVALRAGGLLLAQVRSPSSGEAFGAETGFVLARDPDTVRAPDAAFVTRERAERIGPTVKFWPGAPDLAVEVIAPGDSFGEVEGKALEWLEGGATVVLVLDPKRRSATVYRAPGEVRVHGGQDELDLGDVVPGWRIVVADFFA